MLARRFTIVAADGAVPAWVLRSFVAENARLTMAGATPVLDAASPVPAHLPPTDRQHENRHDLVLPERHCHPKPAARDARLS